MRLIWIGALLSFLLCNLVAHSQYSLSFEGKYVVSFNTNTIELQDNEISTSSFHGAEINFVHDLRKDSFPLSFSVLTGVRYLNGKGTLENTPFSVQTYRVFLGLGLNYKVNSKLSFNSYYGLENNLDFDDFRTKRNDQLRHSFIIGSRYQFHKRWGATLSYQRAFAPTSVHYFITNPKNQFKVGFTMLIL